jgi:hypothetical protein
MKLYANLVFGRNVIYVGERNGVQYCITAVSADGKCTLPFVIQYQSPAGSRSFDIGPSAGSTAAEKKYLAVILANHRGQIENLKMETCKDGDKLVGEAWHVLKK